MATQKPWTIYEAAILLDGFLQFSEGTVSRKQAISNVSTKLRQIAINQDEIIDEIYRNINGITFQMASLESAYRGHTVMKPPTRLFTEIVSIYKTDQTRYQKILEDAMAMCGAHSIAEITADMILRLTAAVLLLSRRDVIFRHIRRASEVSWGSMWDSKSRNC